MITEISVVNTFVTAMGSLLCLQCPRSEQNTFLYFFNDFLRDVCLQTYREI
jgi:hypothetical protein